MIFNLLLTISYKFYWDNKPKYQPFLFKHLPEFSLSSCISLAGAPREASSSVTVAKPEKNIEMCKTNNLSGEPSSKRIHHYFKLNTTKLAC